MKKAIVTGAGGFVGSELVKVLQNNSIQVIAVDVRHIDVSNYKNIKCDLDQVDELPLLIDDRDIDCCIHLAWQGSTGNNRGDYHIQLRNVERTLELCEVLSSLKVSRFVGIGTLAEKDVLNYIPLDGATPNRVACYGVSKLATNYMSKIVCTQLGIEHIWCQLSNLYGVGDKSNNFVNFASKLMLRGERASFTRGEQMYDFVYISDIANAIYYTALNGKNNCCYYLGSGEQKKLKEYINDIRDEIDPNIELFLGEVPFNGVCLADSEFDSTKLENDTGYVSEVSFKEGISLTVNWLKENLENE